MSSSETNHPDRRTFLQAGALATASAVSLAANAQAQQDTATAKPQVMPRRKLGKTGVELTLLEQGAARTPSVNAILRFAYASGVRTFDTAKVYQTEPDFKKWFGQMPEVRKEIFLVTKDMPKTPKEFLTMVDERLKSLGTDYIDLFFIHGLGDGRSIDQSIDFVTCKEFKETADAIRKSGKAKFIGFSTHNKDRAPVIEAAAKAGIVDALMVMYPPWLDKDSPLNKALDVCWEKGVGLITMKQTAGQFWGDRPKVKVLDQVVQRVPMLKEKNLTPFQGLLHAIWTDERVTSSCVSMRNTDQIHQNADAARRFVPLKLSELEQLRDATLAAGPTLCSACDGRCSLAAGTKAELGNLTRFLTYHQHHGDRAIARREYAALSAEARDWSDADLEAAREACPSGLDFARLLPEVDRHLA